MYFTNQSTFLFGGGLANDIDSTSDGVLWTSAVLADRTIALKYSKDNGKTWNLYLNSAALSFPLSGATGVGGRCGILIDPDNYIHIIYTKLATATLPDTSTVEGDNSVHYRRGFFSTNKDDITWSSEYTIQSSISLATYYNYSKMDIVVVKYSTGWRGMVVWGQLRSGTGTTGADKGQWLYCKSLTITGATTPTVTIGALVTLFSYPNHDPFGETGSFRVEFKHNGDGKTNLDATPHLYLGYDSGVDYDTAVATGIMYTKGTFSSGSWSWSANVTLDSATNGLVFVNFNGVDPIISVAGGSSVSIYTRNEANTTTVVDTASMTGSGPVGFGYTSGRTSYMHTDSQKNLWIFLSSGSVNPSRIGILKWNYTAKTWSTHGEYVIWYGRGSGGLVVSRHHPNDKIILNFNAGSLGTFNGEAMHIINDVKLVGSALPSISSPANNSELTGSSINVQSSIGTDAVNKNMYYALFVSYDNELNYTSIYCSQNSTLALDRPLASGSTDSFSWDVTNRPEGFVALRLVTWNEDGITSQRTTSTSTILNIGELHYTGLISNEITLTRNGKREDRMSDGTLWATYTDTTSSGNGVSWAYSKNDGKTWIKATLTGTGATVASRGRIISFYIDIDDYVHVATTTTYNTLHEVQYYRGTPNAGKTSLDFPAVATSEIPISGSYWTTDIVAHRDISGSGWVVHIFAGGSTDLAYARVTVAADGSSSITLPKISLATGAANTYFNPSIDFNHNGDGKTVKNGLPHLYLMFSHNLTGAGKGVRYRKASFASNTWTWDAEIEVDNTDFVVGTMNYEGHPSWGHLAFNGTKVIIAGAFSNGISVTSTVYTKAIVINPDTGAIEQNKAINTGSGSASSAGSASLYQHGTWSYDISGNIYIYGYTRQAVDVGQPYQKPINRYVYNINTQVGTETLDFKQMIVSGAVGVDPGYLASRRNGVGVIHLLIFECANSSANDFMIDSYKFLLSSPPNIPTHNRISNSGYTLNKRPILFFSVSNNDASIGTVDAQLQISTVNTFATISVDTTYGSVVTGWTGLPTANGAATIISYVPQIDLPLGLLYLRGKVKSTTGDWSNWSGVQQFSITSEPWSDTLTSNLYGFKALWMNDLVAVINNARQFRGLPVATFTDGTITAQTTDVKGVHVTERRDTLREVLVQIGTTPTWTNTTPVDRNTQHIIELRNYCKQT